MLTLSSDETVAIGDFVRRQTPESHHSHFDGSEDELLALVRDNWHNKQDGYRDGVVIVPIPLVEDVCFYTPIIMVDDDTVFEVDFKERREGEDKHVSVVARGEKVRALDVHIILYRSDVLEEGNERETAADWEVVSINASPWMGPVPMRPITLARNYLEMKGGTKGDYSALQFAESIWFWSRHATVSPRPYSNRALDGFALGLRAAASEAWDVIRSCATDSGFDLGVDTDMQDVQDAVNNYLRGLADDQDRCKKLMKETLKIQCQTTKKVLKVLDDLDEEQSKSDGD